MLRQELIAANVANPKSQATRPSISLLCQGPFMIPGPLGAKVLEEAMAETIGGHRGWIIAGLRSLEEAANFFGELPADPPAKKGKEVGP